jgi:hypothetical protein
MDRFLENASDFLRERAVFGGGAPAQGFFQMIWDVGADKYALAISHLLPCLSFQDGVVELVKRRSV